MAEVPKVVAIANKELARLSIVNLSASIRRLLAALTLPFLIAGLFLLQPEPSHAASGGRIGGGSFRAPSMPRTGGYGGGYRGGYGGGGYRGYGGGIGFPFILPIFGFGGGGLFGFLILMSIAGVIVNAVRGGSSGASPSIPSSNGLARQTTSPVKMIQFQIGLLANAKTLQEDLRKLATSADTSTPSGLQLILQETTLSLLRQPELWAYANIETGIVPFTSAESTFNRLSMIERSKLSAEVTSNFSGRVLSENPAGITPGEAGETNEYIAVTLLIATKSGINLNEASTNSESLQENLRIIGSTSSNDLMALEVIWQPEGQGEVLSAEELVTAYPNLKHL